MTHAFRLKAVLLAIGCVMSLPSAADAQTQIRRRSLHRRTVAMPPAAPSRAALPPYERDGVPGNAPFNNQLRKFSDPFGANGR